MRKTFKELYLEGHYGVRGVVISVIICSLLGAAVGSALGVGVAVLFNGGIVRPMVALAIMGIVLGAVFGTRRVK